MSGSFKRCGSLFLTALMLCGVASAAGADVIDVGVTTTGNFVKNRKVPNLNWTGKVGPSDVTFFCEDGRGGCQGVLTTEPFPAPRYLEIYTAGFGQNSPTNSFYVVRESDQARLQLKTHLDPVYTWRLRSWKLDSDWEGRPVRMIVENRGSPAPQGWLAVSLPRRGKLAFGYLVYRASARAAVLWIIAFILFVPGLGFAMEARRRRLPCSLGDLVPMAMIATGLAGYAGFWAFFVSVRIGKAWAIAFAVTGGVLALLRMERPLLKLAIAPALTFAFVSSAYCCFDLLYLTDDHVTVATERRFSRGILPPDNYLPELVADRLYQGDSLRPELLSGWHTSDRPPLQAALVDMVRPFTFLILPDLQYELTGIALQCSWIVALWFLLTRIGFTRGQILLVIGFVAFSGFGFFHSVYVWPKMLAAAYLIFGIAFLLPLGESHPVLACLCFALGLLSHTGCGLTLPGLVIPLWIYRKKIRWRWFAVGVCLSAVLLLPWIWFQKVYDPPGDQLLKGNLAGDPFQKGALLQLIAAAYHKLTWKEILERRWTDLKVLFFYPAFVSQQSSWWGRSLDVYYVENFFCLFFSLALLNFGLVVRLSPLWRKMRDVERFRLVDRLSLCVALSTLFWIVIMYDPSATIIHQGSLGNVLLLMAALALYIQALFPRVVYWLLAVQTAVFFTVYVFGKPYIQEEPGVLWNGWTDPGALAVGVASCCGLIYVARRMAATPQSPQERAKTPLSL